MLRLKYFVSFSLMFIFAVMISFQGCQESSIDPEPVGQDTSYSYIRFINSTTMQDLLRMQAVMLTFG